MQQPRKPGLIGEAERYLAAVTAFREEGCEPHWRLERPTRAAATDREDARRGSFATERRAL
jgi:hypothetical protein